MTIDFEIYRIISKVFFPQIPGEILEGEKSVLLNFTSTIDPLKKDKITPAILEAIAADTCKKKTIAACRILSELENFAFAGDMRIFMRKFNIIPEEEEEALGFLIYLLNSFEEKYKNKIFSHISILFFSDSLEGKLFAIIKLYKQYSSIPNLDRLEDGIHLFCDKNSKLDFLINFFDTSFSIPQLQPLWRLLKSNRTLLESNFFSHGQVESKIWACIELNKVTNIKPKNILVICGWLGLLPFMLQNSTAHALSHEYVSVDIDPECTTIAEQLNSQPSTETKNNTFKSLCADINDIDYQDFTFQNKPIFSQESTVTPEPTLIINTACEHITNFSNWYNRITPGSLVLLQSNDFFDHTDHTNCVNNLSEFTDNTPLSKTFFSGELGLNKYTRFMRIGIK